VPSSYPKQTANTIASSSSTVWCSDNYDPDFGAIENNAEALPLNFTLRDAIFPMDGLLAALDCCRNTSPGHDGIHNETLPLLPHSGKGFLPSVYNSIRAESVVPDAWKEAIAVPVLKAVRDRLQATSYRPISLAICLRNTVGFMGEP
jgi:hypothetical protein